MSADQTPNSVRAVEMEARASVGQYAMPTGRLMFREGVLMQQWRGDLGFVWLAVPAEGDAPLQGKES